MISILGTKTFQKSLTPAEFTASIWLVLLFAMQIQFLYSAELVLFEVYLGVYLEFYGGNKKQV